MESTATSRAMGWRIEDEPILRIGRRFVGDNAEDPAYEFHRIRGVDLLAEGGLIVMDGGSKELRRYDGDGQHLWSAGGQGEGPGEFEQPRYLGRFDDGSFVIWDRALRRLTIIGKRGKLLRTQMLASENGLAPSPRAILGDGALLATFPRTVGPPSPGASWTDTIGLWRFEMADGDRRLLTRVPGVTWIWTGSYLLPVPFTANPVAAPKGQGLALASGPIPQIRIYDSTGELEARYVVSREPEAVTAADVRTLVDVWIEAGQSGAPAPAWDEWLDRMPTPRYAPAFDRVFVDASEHIWARRFILELESAPAQVWDVFGSGAYLGPITTPAALEVTAIGDSVLAGVFRGELDVEYPSVYRITKSSH